MRSLQPRYAQAAWWCTAALAGAVLISTAAYNILIAAAILWILLARIPCRIPPVKAPLAIFFGWTLLSVAASPDPQAGWPQLKKFYVFLILLIMYSVIRTVPDLLRMAYVWAGAATLSACWGLLQFARKLASPFPGGADFYSTYVGSRITGFMSHWMTFSGEMMIASTVMASFLCFVVRGRKALAFGIALFACDVAIVLGLTRSVWIATLLAMAFLIAVWKPRGLLVLPAAVTAVLWLSPSAVRERIVSIYRPHGTLDSNEHRSITRATGWNMVRAHPWLGLGPEIPKRDFLRYLPSATELPLPAGYYGHLHNIYLQYAAERGVPALLAILWLIAKVGYDCVRSLPRLAAHKVRYAVIVATLAILIAVLVEGFWEYNLGDGEILAMFLMSIAWAYTAIEPEPDSAGAPA